MLQGGLRAMMQLIDDGTLDTVFTCTVYGEEMRYGNDTETYKAFVDWACEDAEAEHECQKQSKGITS
jgi:hypothetical protein